MGSDSPCTGLCRIDEFSGLCVGCWRTLDEIAAWSQMDATERDRVHARLRERAERSDEERSTTLSEPRWDVVGIGNAIVDVLAHAEDEFLQTHGLEKGAMTLIDSDRAAQIYGGMGQAIEISGGSAANTMVGVASLGGRAAYIGKVRNDQLGEIFAHDIRAADVTFRTPPATDGPPTARCLVLVTPDAQRTLQTHLGIAGQLSVDDLDSEIIEASAVTYLEGYLFDPPAAKEAFYAAARIAHGAGRKVSLTLSDAFCVERHREGFLSFIEDHVDYLFANEAEVHALLPGHDFDAVADKIGSMCSIAALTRGPSGSTLVTDGERVSVDARVFEGGVVDTTGAGDLYAAGVLFGLSRGESLAESGRIGSLAAGEVISHFGARPETSLSELVAAER